MLKNFDAQFRATLNNYEGNGDEGGVSVTISNPLCSVRDSLDIANCNSGEEKYYHYSAESVSFALSIDGEDTLGENSIDKKLDDGSHGLPGDMTFALIDPEGGSAEKSTGTMTVSESTGVKVNLFKNGRGNWTVSCGKVEVKIDGSTGLSLTWDQTDRHHITA